MPRTLTISLPLPPKVLWPNSRGLHWGSRSGAVKACRTAARGKARSAWHDQPPMRCARFVVHFEFCGARRKDPDNCLAAIKPYWDGIVDAGVLVSDSPAHVVSTTITVGRHKAAPRCLQSYVLITITEAE